jgi:hypothetical protein
MERYKRQPKVPQIGNIWIMIWSQLFNTVLKKAHTIQPNVEFLLEIDAKS